MQAHAYVCLPCLCARSSRRRISNLPQRPASVSAKVLLLNEMIAQGKGPAELARLLKTRPQEATRIVDLHHPTKIDTIAAALAAMGKRLEMRLA